MWRDAGFLRVERRPLRAMPTGKILHLHVHRGGTSALGGADVDWAVAGGEADR
jgi:hypothetical protein